MNKKNQIKGYFHMTDFHLCNISFFLTGNRHCGRTISQERTKIYNWCDLGKKMNCFQILSCIENIKQTSLSRELKVSNMKMFYCQTITPEDVDVNLRLCMLSGIRKPGYWSRVLCHCEHAKDNYLFVI